MNLIEVIVDTLAKDEKRNSLLKNSPFLKGRLLEFNRNSITSFIIAELCFEMDVNPKFQSVRLKKEYADIIEKGKNTRAFRLLYKNMHAYYVGNPSLDKALWNITYSYLETVWGIEEIIPDPILLTTYSMHLAKVRVNLKTYFEGALSELEES